MKNIKDLATFTEKELLCALYVKELLKENVSSDYFSYEEILSAITSKYLKKYGECHLTNEELTDWLKDNYRYPLLNDLIENEIIKIICFSQDERDTFVFDNLESIFQIITKEVRDNLLSEINYDYSKVNKETKLTDEEFRQLVTKFLKVIDPSLEWLNIYNEALENTSGTKQDDKFMIQYDGIEYPIPDVGEYKNNRGEIIKDLRINNIIINTDSSVLTIYIGFYHPDLSTRYGINIVCPINYF